MMKEIGFAASVTRVSAEAQTEFDLRPDAPRIALTAAARLLNGRGRKQWTPGSGASFAIPFTGLGYPVAFCMAVRPCLFAFGR